MCHLHNTQTQSATTDEAPAAFTESTDANKLSRDMRGGQQQQARGQNMGVIDAALTLFSDVRYR